jgi:DNA-binding transcriptional ArsR family regulator
MGAVPLSAVMQDAGEASPEIQRMISNAEDASAFLKSLAHGNRLLLLCLLAEKERQPAVSQQLARLRLDGLVTTRREGKAIHYRIADERTKGFIQLIYETFCK